MANILMDVIGTAIFNKTIEAITRPHVPVENANASQVAREVTAAVKPIVTNATNSEPWYRSRIYLGLIAAGVGIALSKFGIIVTGPDLEVIVSNIGTLIEIGGSLFALYGRIRGASLKPLGQ